MQDMPQTPPLLTPNSAPDEDLAVLSERPKIPRNIVVWCLVVMMCGLVAGGGVWYFRVSSENQDFLNSSEATAPTPLPIHTSLPTPTPFSQKNLGLVSGILTLPTFAQWDESGLEENEALGMVWVAREVLVVLPGRVWRAQTTNAPIDVHNDFSKKLSDALSADGWQDFALLQRAGEDIHYHLLPPEADSPYGSTLGMVWVKNDMVQVVGWSFNTISTRQGVDGNKVEFGVFVSEPMSVDALLNLAGIGQE